MLRGHAIIQPRVGTLPVSSRKSRFAAIAAGPPGIDPYTTAVSDVYQDLFGQGSFVGKGIFDVAAFQQVMAGRTPENRLLSHDLFEGIFARSALATDVEVLDEQPAAYAVAGGPPASLGARRLAALAVALATRARPSEGSMPNDLSPARRAGRSSTICAVACSRRGWSRAVAWSWFLHQRAGRGGRPAWCSACSSCRRARACCSSWCASRASRRVPFWARSAAICARNARQMLLSLVFTLDQAWLSRGRHRAHALSPRHPAAPARVDHHASVGARGTRAPACSAGSGSRARCAWAYGWVRCCTIPDVLPFATPLLLLWAAAPLVARWLSQPDRAAQPIDLVSEADRALLRRTARKTWRYLRYVRRRGRPLPSARQLPGGSARHRRPAHLSDQHRPVSAVGDQRARARLHRPAQRGRAPARRR